MEEINMGRHRSNQTLDERLARLAINASRYYQKNKDKINAKSRLKRRQNKLKKSIVN